MANYANLKAAIDTVIKANGQQEITGTVLNQTLTAMVNSLGAGYQFMGVAIPSTNPGTPDQNVFYLAGQAGTYSNFSAIVLQAGLSILKWNGTWSSETLFTFDSSLTENGINPITSGAVFAKMKIDGGAYDVSAHNNNQTFASLSALLSDVNLSTLIPTNIRSGGMSIKFIQSSDNKYVQYFCNSQTFTTIESKWQKQGAEVTILQNTTTDSDGNGTIIINGNDVGEYAGSDKLIKLVGIAPSGATSNVTQVGDIYYNTTTRLLRRCIEWNTSATDSLYETVPFYNGAIYTYQGHIYVYNGDTIVADNADIPAAIQDATQDAINKVSGYNSIPLSSLDNYRTDDKVPDIINSVVGQNVVFEGITPPALTKIIDVSDAIKIQYPTFLSSGGFGSCFVDSEHHFISGYTENVQPTGTLMILDVPANAKYFYIALNSVLVNSIDIYNVVKGGIPIELKDLDSEINTLNSEINTLNSEINTLNSEFSSNDLIDSLESGYFDLSVGIGNTVNISQRIPSGSGTKSACVECQGGDLFSVAGYGGESSRLWGFIDEDNKLISVASPNLHTSVPIRLEAPENARKIIYQTIPGQYEDIFRVEGDVPALKENVSALKKDVSELKEDAKQIIDFSINNDSYYEDGVMLLAMKTNVPNNQLPFNLGYLFCKWNDNNKLYYGVNLNDFKEIQFLSNLNNKTLKYAISPKDGRIIMTVRNDRGSLYVWDSVDKELTELSFNSAQQKPMGWLYNSGYCFDIDENENEICLFAEYSQSPVTSGGFNIWRGTYPYTEESMWDVVMYVPYVGDDASGITHFHQVRRDPWTGIIYATSGDASAESKWWYSTDHGLTFNLLTSGTTSGFEEHICRIINFIFTKNKVYFATDHGTNHCLNSIERNSQTGVLDVSTRLKITDLPYGQATNFLCYSEFPKGIFMYDRWDIGYSPLSPIKVQFYSLETQTLIDVAELQISDTWGGHRGGCYVDYLSTTMGTPAMGFDLNSPCIFKLSNPNIAKIGTISYDVLGKVIHTI